MKKAFLALLLLVGAVAMASVALAAPSTLRNRTLADPTDFGAGLKAPGTSAAAAATDTVWVGLSSSNHYSATTNPNNIYVGILKPNAAGEPGGNNGQAGISIWDWDTFGYADGGNVDSLQGWLPLYHNVDYTTSLAPNSPGDIDHPWLAVDEGNLANVWNKGPYAHNRGIVGVWHADPGVNAGIGVTWTPISGGMSAWCGLREHGDNSVIDQVTGNPFNANCLDWQVTDWVGAGTIINWPGYSRNWDQMLYRDFTPTGQALTLSFNYRTRLSVLAPTRRVGWFHGDPLNNASPNFISAYPTAVIDSFQVFIGAPVNDAQVTLSDGTTPPVYDPQRRWFDEVIQIWDAPYYELTSAAGCNPVASDTTGHVAFSTVVDNATLQTIATAPTNVSGNVRLVFRIKTNNTGDDVNGDDEVALGGRGAAQVDDVTLQWGAGSPTVIGDFEGAEQSGPNSIDNRVSATALTNWKSTGRPVPLWPHARPVDGLPWNDLCGLVHNNAGRICNMLGNVIDFGADGYGESIGIKTITAFQNNYYDVIGPAIDLTTTTSPNPQGLTADRVNPTEDYHISFDIYPGAAISTLNTGILWWYGCSNYPCAQANGVYTWSPEIIFGNAIWYTSTLTCRRTLSNGYKANGCLYTANASNVPDSLRLFIGLYNYPEDWGAGINANNGFGLYVDNISLGFVNKVAGSTLGSVQTNIYDYFSDPFPQAAYTQPTGVFSTLAELDTCGALIKGVINTAQSSANAGLPSLQRNDVLADTIDVTASDAAKASPSDTNSTNVRLDMVFRILPGPGNYRQAVGDSVPRVPVIAGMHLLRRPDDRTTLVNPADGSDHSFWASYIRNPGQFSAGNHNGGTSWDPLTWNSCRMDTTHSNLWPSIVNKTNYQTTMHPEDPHYTELGISRPRCFVIDMGNNARNSTNIECTGTEPVWLDTIPTSQTGWDGQTYSIRGTKIIPDGLLTPGSHVQYFFRKQQVFGYSNVSPNYAMTPDTSSISITVGNVEANADGHRWMEFGVLPDRYKDTAYKGLGAAKMLVADYERRRGDMLVWQSVMDSIGGTGAARWGANNGWHAPGGGLSLNPAVNTNLQATTFTYGNAGAGTLWDLYRASTEGLTGNGNRLGNRLANPGTGLLTGKDAAIGPTPYMLKSYYRAVVMLFADLKTTDLGPATDIPEGDLNLLSDFLTSTDAVGGAATLPRALYLYGQGIVQSEASSSATTGHPAFMSAYPAVAYVNASYSSLANNKTACTDLSTTTAIASTADVYGVGINCTIQQNVVTNVVGHSQIVSYYQDLGHGPYGASVYHPAVPADASNNFIALTDAFRLTQQWGRYCATSAGRLSRTYDVMTHIFSAACSNWANPGNPTNVPNGGNAFANYMKIGNSVMRAGNANVQFGVANTGRVRIRLYDVTGRLIRTLADKTFQGGQEYSVVWDGRSDAGSQVARGVYFARIDYASGAAINGRVVVLQ